MRSPHAFRTEVYRSRLFGQAARAQRCRYADVDGHVCLNAFGQVAHDGQACHASARAELLTNRQADEIEGRNVLAEQRWEDSALYGVDGDE